MNNQKDNKIENCPDCNGNGKTDDVNCGKSGGECQFCLGTGKITHWRKLEYVILHLHFDKEILQDERLQEIVEAVEAGKLPLKQALAAMYSIGYDNGY